MSTADGATERRRGIPVALGPWTAIASVLLVVQQVAPGVGEGRSAPGLLRGWVQFDGPEYLRIAADGYQQRQLVWFPLYPLLVRLVDAVVGRPVTAAVLVSLAGGAVAAWGVSRWMEDVGVAPAARRTAALAVLLYPYGWFLYGVVYSDAVFTAAAVWAFVFVERRRFVAAGLVAALATATRPSGFAVAVGLAVLALERSDVLVRRDGASGWVAALRIPTRLDPRALRPSVAGVLLAWVGLALYCAYQWVAWGAPLRFVNEQANYHEPGAASLMKEQYFDAWYSGFDGRHLATTTAQGMLLLAVIATVPAVGRRFGWGYGVLVGGLTLLPAISVATFMGIGRYLIPAFPVWVLLGEWMTLRPRLRVLWLTVSGMLLLVMAAGFSRSWYLT